MILVSKKDHALLLVFLYIRVSIYRSFSSILTAFICTCGRNVLEFLARIYKCPIERGEAKEETGTRERKKENNCELTILGETSDFNIFVDGAL